MREDNQQGGFGGFGPVGAAGPEDKDRLQGGGGVIAGPRQYGSETVQLRHGHDQGTCCRAGEDIVERRQRKSHVGAALGRSGLVCLIQDH